MTLPWQSGKATVGRLLVHGAGLDPLATRLRLSRLLDCIDLHPAGVPASTVVCVRRLGAPALRSSSLGLHGAQSAAACGGWERAVEAALARLLAHASRPAHGPVPDDAEAVLFFDRAELLACLAADWRRGVAPRRWWWRALLRDAHDGRGPLRAWLDAPECVPAALELLSRRGEAVEFVRGLGSRDAAALSLRLAEAFALHELRAALEPRAGRPRAADDPGEADAALPAEDDRGRERGAHALAAAPPWRPFVPESRAQGIDLEQECLLGVGLVIARAPSLARAHAFAQAAGRWRQDAARGTYGGARAPSLVDEPAAGGAEGPGATSHAVRGRGATPRPTAAGSRAADGRGARKPRATTGARRAEAEARATNCGAAPGAAASAAEEEGAFGSTWPAGGADVDARASTPPRRGARQEQGTEDFPPARPGGEPSVLSRRPPPAPYLLEASVETSLGGLFYLINFGLFLGLYGDFTTPLRPGLALPVWDFVALVGRRLVGAGAPREDAVWGLLARLAGRRDGEEPGRDFAAPGEWRVPPRWLAPFHGARVWRWSVVGGRLRVRHAEGFLLLDVPRGAGAVRRRLRREAARYSGVARFELRRAAESHGGVGAAAVEEGAAAAQDELERWVGWVADYARARLNRALGVAPPRELARVLCEQRARVRVSAAHVEVSFELASLPVEVRLAGLDRDPGWVPAAGRYVSFHFG